MSQSILPSPRAQLPTLSTTISSLTVQYKHDHLRGYKLRSYKKHHISLMNHFVTFWRTPRTLSTHKRQHVFNAVEKTNQNEKHKGRHVQGDATFSTKNTKYQVPYEIRTSVSQPPNKTKILRPATARPMLVAFRALVQLRSARPTDALSPLASQPEHGHLHLLLVQRRKVHGYYYHTAISDPTANQELWERFMLTVSGGKGGNISDASAISLTLAVLLPSVYSSST